MAVTERTRRELHEELELVELLGPDRAETLMESLPPVSWGDIASKQYIDARVERLEERFDLRMEALEHRLLGAMDSKLRQTNITMMAMMTSQTAVLVTLVLALR